MKSNQSTNGDALETTRESPKRSFTIEHRQKLSEAMKGRKAWNKGLDKTDPRVLKNTIATQSNPNLRKNLSKALMGHKSTFNRKHTKEELIKMKSWSLGRKKWYKVWNKGLTKNTSSILAENGKKISISLLKIPKEQRSALSLKARMSQKEYNISKIEQAIADEMVRQSIEIVQSFQILVDKYLTIIDIYIPSSKTCIYIDGIYWHSLPQSKKRDAYFNKRLNQLGYKVVRIPVKRLQDEDVKSIVKKLLDGDIVRPYEES